MMFTTRKFIQSLIFSLLALGLCYAGIEPKETNTLSATKGSTAIKTSALASSDMTALSRVDFSKLLLEASKKLGNRPLPLLTIEGESLPKLLQKVVQVADKMLPDCSAVLSLAITGFAGGVSCPGVDEKAGCYVVVFFNDGNVEPVFLFKAQQGCALVKSLEENKGTTNVLKSKPSNKSTQDILKPEPCWYVYGSAALVGILDNNLEQIFPFICEEKSSDTCLKIGLDFNLWNNIFQKIESKEVTFLKFLWDILVMPDIEKVGIGFDIVDKTLETTMFVCPRAYRPLSAFAKSLESKSKEIRFLNWSSREVVQELVFQDYSGLKNYVESLDSRIKYNQSTEDFCSIFKNAWALICPLIKDVLAFCAENFTGNAQSYADFQIQKDLVSSKGFGFFEGVQLKRDTLLKFVDDFSDKLKSSVKGLVDKKLFGWEIYKDLSLNIKRSVEKHHDCDIDQVFWKCNGNEAYYPIWFAICKNYLLYADDISNLKRLIERMEEMKEPSYMPREEDCFSRAKMDFISVLHTLGVELPKPISALSFEIACGLKDGIFVNTIKVPGFLDIFSLKTILPSADENAKKDDVNHSNNLKAVSVEK